MAAPYPASELDPLSPAFLSDPHPCHERLRQAGPVVWLERYGVWAMARHEQVQVYPAAQAIPRRRIARICATSNSPAT
jgi:cytochrome P450